MSATTRAGMPVSGSVDHAGASEGMSSGGSVLTPQQRGQLGVKARRANAAARRARTADRRAALATRTAPTGYRIGTWVRTNTPRSPRFHGRVGVVVANNLGEVGVGFGTDWSIQLPVIGAWFRPAELERVR